MTEPLTAALRQEGPQQELPNVTKRLEHLTVQLKGWCDCGGEGCNLCRGARTAVDAAMEIVKLRAALSASRTAQAPQQDQMCEHGTAMDVHCCNCHSGFIFDRDHVCPSVDRLVGRLREVAFRETVTDVAEGEDPPEITWEELGEISTLLTEAANKLQAAQARIQVLETSVDYLRYLVDHPVTQGGMGVHRPVLNGNNRSILVDRDADMRREMRAYLDTLTIQGDNIGEIRRSLFMPFNSQWNGWVRDDTAEREISVPPPVAPAEGEQ